MPQQGIKAFFILHILLLSLTAFANPTELVTLDSKWKMEQVEQFSSMSPQLRESLKGKLVIFVAGFWNEASTPFLRYFGAGFEAVQDELQMEAIRFYPKSYLFKSNVEDLYKLVVGSFKKYNRP